MPVADLNDTRLYCERSGVGSPPLVFVLGFACSHEDWARQVETLARRHTVLTCDLRGHGTSPGVPSACDIETFGADVAGLLRVLQLESVVLVGNSMGCRVVLQAYRDAPDRVAGLVLVDGSFLGGAGESAQTRMSKAIAAFAQRLALGRWRYRIGPQVVSPRGCPG
jgi:pimeloyl-ACP methyl ester carboxylesterase